MLNITGGLKVFLAVEPADMRKGFGGLYALAAEKMDHHPDWSNVYKTVEVRLNTHDVGGLTALDFELAGKMNRIFGG